MKKQKNKKLEAGITLIALVVTIIVLIILAGVSIAMLVGENGIITQAQRADELTTQAQQEEAIELAIASVQAQGSLELDKTKLATALQSQLGDTSYTLIENEDGSFLLQIAERSYYIDSTGEVMAEENMIAIGSTEELKAFRDDVNSGNTYEGKYVYLTNNITLDINEEWEPIGIYQQTNESVLADSNCPFKGIFDGMGYEISGLKILSSQGKGAGLFGLVRDGKIKNLGIGVDCDINVDVSFGTITGFLCDGGVVSNCYNKAQITSSYANFGGIVGVVSMNCSIIDCYNCGIMNANENSVGGIVGNMANSSYIDRCYNNNLINGSMLSSNVGGLVGTLKDDCTISNSYNSGEITGHSQIGGIVGSSNNSKIINCYNVKDVNSDGYNVSGIVGLSELTRIENCYNIGGISSADSNINNDIIGTDLNGSSCINCYSRNETFKYLDLGNAFKEDINNMNNAYPILIWQ